MFSGNRKNKFYNNHLGPKEEFFYGLDYFNNGNYEINIIEPDQNTNF